MTSRDDITGVARCVGRKSTDISDRELWALIEAAHPGAWSTLLAYRNPGERVHIPHDIEGQRERAERMDDGKMSLRDLAALAGVSLGTAWAARNEKSRA